MGPKAGPWADLGPKLGWHQNQAPRLVFATPSGGEPTHLAWRGTPQGETPAKIRPSKPFPGKKNWPFLTETHTWASGRGPPGGVQTQTHLPTPRGVFWVEKKPASGSSTGRARFQMVSGLGARCTPGNGSGHSIARLEGIRSRQRQCRDSDLLRLFLTRQPSCQRCRFAHKVMSSKGPNTHASVQ